MHSPDPIYRDLISASAGEKSFDAAIETAVQWFGGGGGIAFELNRKTGRLLDWATPTLIMGDDGYNEHINSINPRMRFSLRHAPGHIAYEGRFLSERAIDRHEFYDWLNGRAGLRYFLGSRVYDAGDTSLFFSIEFSKHHGHPDSDKIEAFKRLAPAVGDAWRLRRRTRENGDASDVQTWLPDHLPWGVIALSPAGTVTGMNRPARTMVGRRSAIEISLDTPRAIERHSDIGLQAAIRSALAGSPSETLIKQVPGGAPLVVQVLPVDPHGVLAAPRVAAVMYVRSTLDGTQAVGPVLGRLYGFTDAEQRLAEVLATWAELAAAADILGLSRNTVRNRLQSMYAKTGTRRQSELLVRILGLLAPDA
ncbi:MAG: hypothetical protein C0606_00650 [Hyphomicrobiales bacterium]|nr:MAG: hypothetical protein C0606_00650 [Hyphomicrobiales bacterium]